jgi:hypothetical protein
MWATSECGHARDSRCYEPRVQRRCDEIQIHYFISLSDLRTDLPDDPEDLLHRIQAYVGSSLCEKSNPRCHTGAIDEDEFRNETKV